MFMLEEFVNAADIPVISSLRISRTSRPDSFCWDHSKSGLYTVRSGYEVSHGMRTRANSPAVLEPSTTALKNAVWKIKAPRKLKHFLWQAVTGSIATAQQLKERHCTNDSTCVRCGVDSESINHTLFLCPPALQSWALSAIPTAPGVFPCQSLFTNIDYLLTQAKARGVSPALLADFPWSIWYTWKGRNEKLFNNKDVSPLHTIQSATKEAKSWRLAQCLSDTTEFEVQQQPMISNNPSQALALKKWRCQVDASWIAVSDSIGMGFVLLEEDRPILYGARGNLRAETPLHAEAEGLLWATQEMIKTGNREVHFESDCEQLVKLIQKEEDWPALAPELDEIKALSTEFLEFSIRPIRRSLNVRADHLAKGGRSRGINFVNRFAPCWLASHAGQADAN